MKISFSTMSTLMSLFLLGCLGFASAAGELQARLHPVQGEPVPGQLQIQLQILNKDPENPLEIPQRIFPVAGEPEEEFPYLPQDLFEVRDSEGHPAEYVGMLARRSASEPATVLLAPNGVLSSVLDLSRDYALEKDGVYTVTYRANLDEEHTVVSNTLEVRVSDPQGDRRKTYASLSAPQGPAGWINCGATENQLIGRAAQAATNLTRNSWSCLRQGTCRGPFSRWFGAQSASAQNQVLSHTARMWQHFNAGSYRVWCNHPQCQSDIYAFVYSTDRTRTINLCGAFWSIPSERVATLIHEMSHFNDVAATRDIVYGEEGCLRLARRQPHQALVNADNLCYFTENR